MAPENFPLDSVELSSILGNIWNNSIEAGERLDGDILSVKQGKEHGLGIRRVKELVEKADGVLQITSDNKIFSVHIMIPDKENNKLL